MSAKIQSIVRQGPGPRDPDRLALAAAIAAADATRRAVDSAKASVGRAARMVDEAEERLASATAAVVAARDSLARRVTTAATTGSALAPDRGMREARAHETDAADQLEAARAALAGVEASLEDPAYQHRKAQERVEAAARAVLAGSLEGAVANLTRLKAQINEAYGAVWQLHRSSLDPWAPPTPEQNAIKFQLFPPELRLTESNPGAARFEEYLEALKIDADASPPTL